MWPLAFAIAAVAGTPVPPPLDLLASIWQPADQPVYGALSVTNAWGSLLLSSSNVLAINAVTQPPFSSGWDATNLYGWPVDTASLYLDGVPVPPAATLWTPYSGIRNGSAGGAAVASEVRWVFEGQAILFEVNITLPNGGLLNASVDFLLPLRYYPRADGCSSWHYPTHSEPCCFNWFPPMPAPGQENYFIPSWASCNAQPGVLDALSQHDTISAAGSAVAFPGACGSGGGNDDAAAATAAAAAPPPPPSTPLNPGHLARFRAAAPPLGTLVELGAPNSAAGTRATWLAQLNPGDTARLRFALAFSNATDPSVNVGAARALAAAFPLAWAHAAEDWGARFASAFDPERSHFSGFLPLLATGSGNWAAGFDSPMERVYYASVIGLLANERTNLPVPFPDAPGACPVAATAAAAFNRSAAAAAEAAAAAVARASAASSGVHRYLPEALKPLFGGSAFSGGAALRGSFRGGEGASRLLRRRGGASLSAGTLLDEADAPWRLFVSGGGMNTSTNIFYWDNQYGAQVLLMLEPETFARNLLLWMGSVDELGTPSYLAFWGYDYAARRGVGNYYSTNCFTLLELIHAYLRVTGDFSFLNTTLSIGPFPNGTYAHARVYDLSVAMARHWRAMAPSGHLADYGLAPNLLECVPSYIHYVASCNAGNAWMSAAMAEIAGARGDAVTAAALAADAAAIADEVLARLYLPSKGFFAALQPNGSAVPVQHVMDYVYVTRFLGVAGGAAGGRVGAGVITAATAAEMAAFVRGALLVPHWMRALSLTDPAAPLSNRSDHGPSGAYIGWPALTVKALASQGLRADALAFLNDTLFVATLGPYGQAVEVRPPGDPYKPMDVTLYNAMVSHAFADAIADVAFGWEIPLVLPGGAAPSNPLKDPGVPRGFTGTLFNVEWLGRLYNVVSRDDGLSFVAAAHE